jgi:hypothetical protein
MDIPNPPTDNLYKFAALAGIAAERKRVHCRTRPRMQDQLLTSEVAKLIPPREGI